MSEPETIAIRTREDTERVARFWDEMADVLSITQSEIWNPNTGFGGNGEDGDGCVTDGPFGGMVLHLHSDHSDRPYCLNRNFDQGQFDSAHPRRVNRCYDMDNFRDAWPCYEGDPHNAGHNGIGGVVSIRFPTGQGEETRTDSIGVCRWPMLQLAQEVRPTALCPVFAQSSPTAGQRGHTNRKADPIFWLHHAYLDKLFDDWQQGGEGRQRAVSGPNIQPGSNDSQLLPEAAFTNYNGDNGPETTAKHVLWMAGILPNVTISDVMDLSDDVICAEYIGST